MSKTQSIIVELQATISFISHATETFVPTITKKLKNIPMPPNDKYLEPMRNEDIVSHYSSLSLNDALLQMVVEELFVQK
jgi:hypothetical protein